MKQLKETLEQRRDEIRVLLVRKTPLPEIMAILRISRATLWRDIAALREEDQKWLDELAKDQFVHAYRIALDSLEERQRKLMVIADEGKRDRDRIEAHRLIKEIELDRIQLLAEGPTVISLKKRAGVDLSEKLGVQTTS